jgi:hypothetical protein
MGFQPMRKHGQDGRATPDDTEIRTTQETRAANRESASLVRTFSATKMLTRSISEGTVYDPRLRIGLV